MRMQQKRATAAVWENSSLILLEGEIGLELDAGNNTFGQKIGNGLDVWSALPYSSGGGHVIQDSAGTELPKEGVLQFAGMEVTDDPVDGKTVVHGLGVKLADRAPVPGVPLHAVLKPVSYTHLDVYKRQGQYGKETGAIDLLNGSLDAQTEKLKNISTATAEQNLSLIHI